MYKIISILLILGLFCGFCTFELLRKSDKAVIGIISPTVVEVADEIICLPDVKTFTSDLNTNQSELEKTYNVSHNDAVKLGYLTEQFADNFLTDKRVKLKYTGEKNQFCRFAEIYVDKHSYKEHLINSGFDLRGDFAGQLEKAKKLKLVILNHKSNKYHKLDCKYGLTAHDIALLQEKQLPKDAKPCKFCHVTDSNKSAAKTHPIVISTGDVKMYLTDLTTTLKPDTNCSTLICSELLSLINSSEKSIDMALYGWGEVPAVLKALNDAKNRGVKIRIVYDTSKNNYYPDTKKLLKFADAFSTDTPKIIMHNKFIIFDDKKLLTGSMNFSPTGLSGFNSNCIFSINSADIANIYKLEFEQMLKGNFHNDKTKLQTKTVQLSDIKLTPLFSPKDKIITKNIIPMVEGAKNYIYIPAFILTHDKLAEALIQAHKRGVTVKIIADAVYAQSYRSKVKILRDAGILVKVENYAGKIHSKTIIIDDKFIIAGSMNFSNSGENKNDENCLIIENSRLAKYYREFFEYIWNKIPDKYLNRYVKAESKESIGSCSDGIDNNYDGKIDMEDAGCN